ncbi:sucrase ferredoxin [Streptacidiphilus sp. PB12-B1b]|uniref:sucrase ferredoxin n=1 Tax=Streptacidiphilus sp. PB12-B1b TaxID=2705012 RepID=UPI0015FD9620|nr:sucrase ferredoxin [Streptacidiphilus sp. PB12-B1b]QMU78715.1 sucrase ferredoxin [Streptacidiphilus sp. PB12-B1b]
MSTCTTLSRVLAEPLGGSATTGATWLLLEQSGPWGARALTQSHLDPAVGRALEARSKGTGLRVALIRRPGRHAERPPRSSRRVYLAHTSPDHPWVRETEVADPAELLSLDFAALGAGDHGGTGSDYRGEPLALVCTNGRRDRCCAVLGRPLAAELAADGHSTVWETTHLGGHRFSPTMLVFPYGYAYGRLSANTAKEILTATHEGRMVPEWCRGRSFWQPASQAAELAIRQAVGEDRADALTLHQEAVPDGWTVTVAHRDGRVWTVEVQAGVSEPPRSQSCGAELVTPARYEIRTIRPALVPV